MKLALNKEGMRYIPGLAPRDDQGRYSQVVLSTDELELFPSYVDTTGFSSLADAHRDKEKLQGRLGESPSIYQLIIDRPVIEPTGRRL